MVSASAGGTRPTALRTPATPAWWRRCSSTPRAPTGCTASAISSHDPGAASGDRRGDPAVPSGGRVRRGDCTCPRSRSRPTGWAGSCRPCCAGSCRRSGWPVPVVEHVSQRSKEQRILEAFDPLLAAGALRAHASVWASPFIEEMREWRPGAPLPRRRSRRRERLPARRAGTPAGARAGRAAGLAAGRAWPGSHRPSSSHDAAPARARRARRRRAASSVLREEIT